MNNHNKTIGQILFYENQKIYNEYQFDVAHTCHIFKEYLQMMGGLVNCLFKQEDKWKNKKIQYKLSVQTEPNDKEEDQQKVYKI